MTDELTAEERSILLFLVTYFKQNGMRGALEMLRNPDSNPADLRPIINHYRDLWRRRLMALP